MTAVADQVEVRAGDAFVPHQTYEPGATCPGVLTFGDRAGKDRLVEIACSHVGCRFQGAVAVDDIARERERVERRYDR